MNELHNIGNDQLFNELLRRLKSTQHQCHACEELEKQVRSLSAHIRDSEKEKSTFVSNVRNEINNPLTSILGLAESIARLSREEKIRSLASLVHQQAFALDFQMRNVIIASEIESGNICPLISQVNVRSLIESQIDYLSSRINSAEVAIKLNIEESLCFPTDAFLLQTICINLLANAVEFSGKTKVVIVSASLAGANLRLNVTDFGEGIMHEKQNMLFKRFKQLDSGPTKSHAGQGLGLAIVHELVSILSGTIDLNSTVNTGTSISIQLSMGEAHKPGLSSAYGNEVIFSDGIEF